jgi:hypothetical protein
MGLSETVEAAFEIAHYRGTVKEADWLANVNILFDWGVKKGGVDVKLTKFEVHGGRNGEKEPEAGHANDRGEGLSVVETRALTAALGDDASFEARYGTLRVGLDLVDPHIVEDHAVGGDIDEFPRAVVHE